jgi:Fe-S-cluster containining protein
MTASPALRAAITETRAVLRKADAAWAKHSCPSSAECCQLKTTGRPPWLWPSEWQLLMQRTKGTVPPERADGGCAFLDADGKRCTVYEDRPFGCRTFFCHRIRGPAQVPSGPTEALLERLKALNLALDDEARVRSLPDLIREAR